MPRVTYPALIEREQRADGTAVYGVVFPDFPGCVSVGDSLVEAIRNGEAALALHVAGMLADGDALPPPSEQLEQYRDRLVRWLQEDGAENIVHVQLITVALPGPARRVNVMLDETLLEEIDAVTNNRSAFLAAAARAELDKRRHQA